jgi:ankyrin repeat protein
MSDESRGSASAASLPDNASLEWLRKQAKQRLRQLREASPEAKLADAQLALAREYGFASWRALKAQVDALTVEGQLFAAARAGDVATVASLLDEHPDRLRAREKPYGWTLLHAAAHKGQLAAVELLLRRGLDANLKEQGDDTYAMHWAAAAGSLDVVRRLADAGGDVIGHGDDHELEVIGWATCWEGGDDAAHRAVADFLVSRGARHHIYSAIALSLEDEVRRLVAERPAVLHKPMSRNEHFELPLQFAVRMNRERMVALLLELGVDPSRTDGVGMTTAVYAASPKVAVPVIAALAGGGVNDLFTQLALGRMDQAERLLAETRGSTNPGNAAALHLLSKRGDARAVRWLLEHGADPNARWNHWDSLVVPLHLAVLETHPEIVRILLDAGADPSIKDTKHDADALEWAEFFQQEEIARIIRARAAAS